MRPITTGIAKESGSGKAVEAIDRGEIFERIWLSKDRDAGAEVHATAAIFESFCEQTRPAVAVGAIFELSS